MKDKASLHPRSAHHGRYDFTQLIASNPDLQEHVFTNEYGNETINFFEPEAVKELNKGLLLHHYQLLHWNVPEGYLCPPIPGRADYIHYLKDVLNTSTFSKEELIKVLDIGTGANCIYPLLGASIYGWNFVASDVDPVAVKSAQENVSNNPHLKDKIEIRSQKSKDQILKGIIQPDDFYHISLCNPPFHASAKEAAAASNRKLKNLKAKSAKLNFGGKNTELWCPGGEIQFVMQYIKESKEFKKQVKFFSCLLSKEENIRKVKNKLKSIHCPYFKVIEMYQGNKKTRFVVWSFFDMQ